VTRGAHPDLTVNDGPRMPRSARAVYRPPLIHHPATRSPDAVGQSRNLGPGRAPRGTSGWVGLAHLAA
jgi:hypothetical protein